jgi:phosphohistidine phosphatase
LANRTSGRNGVWIPTAGAAQSGKLFTMTERTLVLLRHAKADHPSGVSDEQRPLTARGHADAGAAGAWLARGGLRPDLVICSPAKRTRQTWHGVAVALPGDAAPQVRYEQEVYDGGAEELLSLVRGLGDEVRTVLLIGHNPSVSMLSSLLDPAAQNDSDGLRTSGLAVHRAAAWANFGRGAAAVAAVHTARS